RRGGGDAPRGDAELAHEEVGVVDAADDVAIRMARDLSRMPRQERRHRPAEELRPRAPRREIALRAQLQAVRAVDEDGAARLRLRRKVAVRLVDVDDVVAFLLRRAAHFSAIRAWELEEVVQVAV